MIYEANHESHIEKLEDFFNKRKIILAEMKAIQRLARRSKVSSVSFLFNLGSKMDLRKMETFILLLFRDDSYY